MLIDCPACARSYHVGRGDIGEHGRAVICPRCSAQWFVDGHGGRTADDLMTDAVSERADDSPRGSGTAPRRARLGPMLGALAAMLSLGCATTAIAARERVVRDMPRSAALYAAIGLPVNVRGLDFAALAPVRVASGDVTVSGTIRNVVGRRVEVPRLSFEIRDAAGATLMRWRERAARQTLASGRTLGFTSTPHHLPEEARTVLVRFEDDDAGVQSAGDDAHRGPRAAL